MKKLNDTYTKTGKNLPEVPWKEFVHDFKALRKSKKMSQGEVEQRSGTSKWTVQKFEHGQNATIKTIQSWYDAIGEPLTVRIGDESAEVSKLRRENAELKKQVEILKAMTQKSHS